MNDWSDSIEDEYSNSISIIIQKRRLVRLLSSYVYSVNKHILKLNADWTDFEIYNVLVHLYSPAHLICNVIDILFTHDEFTFFSCILSWFLLMFLNYGLCRLTCSNKEYCNLTNAHHRIYWLSGVPRILVRGGEASIKNYSKFFFKFI